MLKKYVLIALFFPVVLFGNDDLDRKIGQMLMVGFRGTELDVNSVIVEEIKEGKVGAVMIYAFDTPTKMFKRNIASPDQLKSLCQTLASHAKIPLIIGIDQEGGVINHLLENWGFAPTISAAKLGNLDDPELTRLYARSCAQTLKSCGINMNFAPVVDINVNPTSPAIGAKERTFSNDPQKVIKHAAIVVEEHEKLNILSVLKHFPGHGSATADSHKGFVDVSNSWTPNELKPYEYFISQGFKGAILTAHVYCDQLDSHFPITLSEKTLKGLLRNKMGYEGVLISDDMQMGAIHKHYSLEESIQKALEADVDLLVFSNQQMFDESIGSKVHAIIKSLINKGTISEERINRSYERILSLKKELNPR